MADPPDRLAAALAGRYQIERLLGSGGMADVYLAQDLKHPRRVAIKVLKPELAALLGRERFQREIALAATLQHPYILPLWDSGSAGELLYYVMPYLEGDSLRHRLEREKQLPLADALRITGEVAEALDYAHGKGVVHRDIKPENILFEGGHALVADFGIARAVGLAAGTQLTETGVTLGTPAYMSTEQALGGRGLDGRSDQYSLACVAYEMLAGQPPFTGATAETVVHQHVAAAPRPVTELRATVPAAMAAALTRALAKAPADRYAGAGEFAAALQAGGAGEAGAATTRVSSAARQRRVVIAGAATVVAAAALGVWWWREFGGRPAVADPAQKDLILVAQFEGPADDPELAPAVRSMIMAAIDQSRIAAAFAGADLSTALRNAGKPDSTRVDAALARELAHRRSIRAVLEGQVARLGGGYSIMVRLVDVETDRVLLSTNESASDQQMLIPAIQKLGQRLRTALGEQRATLRASRPFYDVVTPDFPAFLLYVRGREANTQGDFDRAARLMRAAIDRDPQFGSAWRSLGANLGNLGMIDSSQWAYEQAHRCTGRLSEYDKLNIEGALARNRRDLPAWLNATEQALRTNLTPSDLLLALIQRGAALGTAGRIEEQMKCHRLAVETSPWGPSDISLSGLFFSHIGLGEFEQAREIAERMLRKEDFLARLEVFRGDWAAAESIGSQVASDAAIPLSVRFNGACSAASGSAARGRMALASNTLAGIRQIAETANNVPLARNAGDQEWTLALYSGRRAALEFSSSPTDTSFEGQINRASWAAVAGRKGDAAGQTMKLRQDPRSQRPGHRIAIVVLQGWSVLLAGRDEEAKYLLGPVALQSDPTSYGWWPDRWWRQRARWLMANVYERSGKPDSAAIVLELLLAPVGRYHDIILWRGYHFSFAHQRLVLLYARMGRLEDARRHWEAFQKAFDDPDPELRPLIAEAKDALAAAEGVASGMRR